MDSSTSIRTNKIHSSDQNIVKNNPSKWKELGFAIFIIAGLGGMAVAGIGLGGYLHTGLIGRINSIIMMAAGSGGGIVLLTIGIISFVKLQLKSIITESNKQIVTPSTLKQISNEDAQSTVSDQGNPFRFDWNQIDQHAKVDLVNTIIDNPEQGTKKIRIGNKTIAVRYQFKDAGTSASVYTVYVEEAKFALKILNSSNLGESAKYLQQHSIIGIVPLRTSEILKLNGLDKAIIVMDYLEETWTNWFEKPNNPNSSSLTFGLSCIKQIIEALIDLEKQGFVHGNIGAPNIMFDKQDRIYIIDIDQLLPITDTYAFFKRQTDIGNLKNLLLHVLQKNNLHENHSLWKFCYSSAPETLEMFLEEFCAHLKDLRI